MTNTPNDLQRLQQIKRALHSAEEFHEQHAPNDPSIHEYGLARAQAEDMIEERLAEVEFITDFGVDKSTSH